MRLEDWLKARNMTHKEFADLIGCEQPTVTRYVGGRIPTDAEVMRKIVAVTGGEVTPNDFYGVAA